jgi:hypothetical protein
MVLGSFHSYVEHEALVEKYPYLLRGRLQDVLALIQVLGFNPAARRTENQLVEILQCAPECDLVRWSDVAARHSEFFRVAGQNQDSVCLAARHAAGERDDERKVPARFVEVLMRLAVEIHDRQAGRAERWTTYLPLVVAIIGAIGSIVATLIALTGHKS